jgi:hypothetical protein
LKTGDVQADKPLRAYRHASACTVDGCDRPSASRGLCDAHYRRWLDHGDPQPDKPVLDGKRICEVARCGQPHHARGMCSRHYARWLRARSR